MPFLRYFSKLGIVDPVTDRDRYICRYPPAAPRVEPSVECPVADLVAYLTTAADSLVVQQKPVYAA